MLSTVSVLALLVARSLADPVQFQRCPNFQATYSGAYLADRDLFLDANFKEVNALEWASRFLWNKSINRARNPGQKDGGCAYKPAGGHEDAFAIMHLSGTEHQLVKRFGFEKGMAAMQQFTNAVVAKHAAQCATLQMNPAFNPPLARYAALIPFYGGQGYMAETNGTLRLSSRRKGSPKPEYEAKVGNSHTLASPELKLWQLAAVVCSLAPHMGKVVVGVCGDAERDKLLHWVTVKQAEQAQASADGNGPVNFNSCLKGIDVVVLPCDDMPVHLPFKLLQWAQSQLQTQPLASSTANAGSGKSSSMRGAPWNEIDGVYYTEADNVLIMGRGGVNSVEDPPTSKGRRRSSSSSSSSSTRTLRSTDFPDNTATEQFDGVLTAEGVSEMMELGNKNCFLAPSRFEMKMVSARPIQDDPFSGRILIGQNVCRREGPPGPVTVQQ